MKPDKKGFVELLYDLCDLYKDYIRDNGGKLEVIIEANVIKIYLFNDDKLKDEFSLEFNNKEEDIYTYISLLLFKILFGNKCVYSKNNTFFDNIGNPSIEMMVNDVELSNQMFNLITYSNCDIYDILNNKSLIKKVNKASDSDLLEKRVEVTRGLIRSRSI